MARRKFSIPRTGKQLYTSKTKLGHKIYFKDGTLFSARKFNNKEDAVKFYKRIKRIGKR